MNYFLIFTHLRKPGLTSAGFECTGSIPAGLQEAFRAVHWVCVWVYIYIYDSCSHVKILDVRALIGYSRICVCACMYVFVCVCMCACVCVCVSVCWRTVSGDASEAKRSETTLGSCATYDHATPHRIVLPCVCMGWLQLVGSLNYRSVLQNIVSFIGLFCKRDL